MERGGKVFGNDNGQSFAEDAWITRERKLRCSIEEMFRFPRGIVLKEKRVRGLWSNRTRLVR